jgi:hypothetical protein
MMGFGQHPLLSLELILEGSEPGAEGQRFSESLGLAISVVMFDHEQKLGGLRVVPIFNAHLLGAT